MSRIIKAFTESGKTFDKDLQVRRVLSFGFPCEYPLASGLIDQLQYGEVRKFCIDAGGRNHGVNEAEPANMPHSHFVWGILTRCSNKDCDDPKRS